jgi:hypothetical protein
MLTGELRNQIDSIWNDFWSGAVDRDRPARTRAHLHPGCSGRHVARRRRGRRRLEPLGAIALGLDREAAQGAFSEFLVGRKLTTKGEIDAEARTWCIPADRTKNRKAHIVQLSEPAWAVISGHLAGKYIFPTSTGHHFQAYSQSKPTRRTLRDSRLAPA